MLKYCAPVLAPHLDKLFLALLAAGFFPVLSEVRIHCSHCKVWKSGERCDVQNYRQITILTAIAKVFEIIVLDHSYFHLRKCIPPEQHVFLRNRSTITNLLEFQNFEMSAYIYGLLPVWLCYLDFAKEFDKVNHCLLITKLEAYGMRGSLLRSLEIYLKGGVLMVK